jgi:hypothetical protein
VLSNLAIKHPVHVDVLGLEGTSGEPRPDQEPTIDREARHPPVRPAVSASDNDPLFFRNGIQNRQPCIWEISFNLSQNRPYASTPYLSPVVLAVLSEAAGCSIEVAAIERVVKLFDYAPVSLGNVQGISLASAEDYPSLRNRLFRYRLGSLVFSEQFAFRLHPVVDIVSINAAALDVDLVCTQFDLFRCRMSLDCGCLVFQLRRFFCGLKHIRTPSGGICRGW